MSAQEADVQVAHCLNCGAALEGDFCHACGQPVQGLVRDFRLVFMDAIATLLNYDKRIWRTLIPLYFRPAHITNDFIRGRQARYVPPFRLFFVLSLVTFLALQFLVDPQESFNLRDSAEVQSFDPAEWQVAIGWLPQAVNDQLNVWLQQALANVERAGEDPNRLVDSMLNLLPVALFILMPVFALLLKILYLFSGRLYMEHLIVALHSHAFLFMAILVCAAISLLISATTALPLVSGAMQLLFEAAQLWLVIYLFIMQKLCYGQGWLMTVSKFLLLGILYSVMIAAVVFAAGLISLITF